MFTTNRQQIKLGLRIILEKGRSINTNVLGLLRANRPLVLSSVKPFPSKRLIVRVRRIDGSIIKSYWKIYYLASQQPQRPLILVHGHRYSEL